MTKAIQTAVKLLESLPENTQESLVEELRRLALEAQDDAQWNAALANNNGLTDAAQQARDRPMSRPPTSLKQYRSILPDRASTEPASMPGDAPERT